MVAAVSRLCSPGLAAHQLLVVARPQQLREDGRQLAPLRLHCPYRWDGARGLDVTAHVVCFLVTVLRAPAGLSAQGFAGHSVCGVRQAADD